MKAAYSRDEAALAGSGFGNLHRPFDGFGTAGDKEGISNIAWCDFGKKACQHATRRIKQLLCRHRGPVQLRFDRFDDFLVTPSKAEEPVAAEAVQERSSQSVGKGGAT